MKRKNRVSGSYPTALYRCFDKEEYAVQFVQEGKFRVGLLEGYQKIECSERRDPTEGTGVYLRPGRVTVGKFPSNPAQPPVWVEQDGLEKTHTSHGQAIYLFCCSARTADLEKLKGKFGRYVVKILSPVSLANEIDHFLNGFDGKAGSFLIEGREVEYTKGQLVDDGRTETELADLSYIQKPAREDFCDDMEFRFCLHALGDRFFLHQNPPAHLDIDLGGGRYSYAKMV